MTPPQLAQRRGLMPAGGVWRAVLAVALAVAGVMHLLLTAEHFGQSTLMGLGFAAATVVELGLAAAVMVRPGRWLYAAVIAISSALVALYLYNVFIGLPFAGSETAAGHGDIEEHAGHHTDGLVVGAGEPVDAAGAFTKGAELISIGIAAGLLRRERPRTP